MIGILCKAHCILPGYAGLSQTLLISILARLMDRSFHRVPFTQTSAGSITGGTYWQKTEAGQVVCVPILEGSAV